MAYRPKPSQTRYGQGVDNPPALDDTARLRMILQDHREDWHEAIGEVQRIQAVHGDRWREYFQKDYATQADVHALWVMLTCIGAVALALFGWMLTRVH